MLSLAVACGSGDPVPPAPSRTVAVGARTQVDNPGQTPMKDDSVDNPGQTALRQHVDNPGQTP